MKEIGNPKGLEPAGYAHLIARFGLVVMPPYRLSFIAAKGGMKERDQQGQRVVTYPPAYHPGPEVPAQLEFALKYDGVNLEVLAAIFLLHHDETFASQLTAFVREKPTGQYARRLWFLYEFLTGLRLALPDVQVGNYVPLLDPSDYFTGIPIRSRRHRVANNLLGNASFCPTVRRTETLRTFAAADVSAEAHRIADDFDADIVKRAINYFYTQETKSSFDIEGEKPSPAKTERFIDLLQNVARIERLSETELVRLQNATVDPRFADVGYRKGQVYVGEQMDLSRQRIHYIAPKATDLADLMKGFVECLHALEGAPTDAVVQAAVVSFGFVFIHPFSDGNGRLHRLLIHYILARTAFTPKGLIVPVSAVMLQRRNEYDECLEAFSRPLMRLVDYTEDAAGQIDVHNDTVGFYRYFDATRMAESLYRWVQETVRDNFRKELEFIVRFRETRREMELVVELPDRLANLFVKLCLSNGGRLSASKRKKHFSAFTDDEIVAMEKLVTTHFHLPA